MLAEVKSLLAQGPIKVRETSASTLRAGLRLGAGLVHRQWQTGALELSHCPHAEAQLCAPAAAMLKIC